MAHSQDKLFALEVASHLSWENDGISTEKIPMMWKCAKKELPNRVPPDSLVVLPQNMLGFGVMTMAPIRSGDIVAYYGGRVVSSAPERSSYVLQVCLPC
jgi:hypothetical protein